MGGGEIKQVESTRSNTRLTIALEHALCIYKDQERAVVKTHTITG